MNVPDSLSNMAGKYVLKLRKNSPHILFVAGVVGSVGSTVLACRATLRLSETLDEIKEDLNNVEKIRKSLEDDPKYTENDHKKDLAYVYISGGIELTKLYGPAVLLGVASIAALTGSHVQMTRRNTALMAAYAALHKAYMEYRDRVRQELGDERELEIYHGSELDVDESAITDERVMKTDPNGLSPYSIIFDEYNVNWEKDPELNRLFLQCQQAYANQRLRAKGHLFLNEVYDWLGVDRTKAGAVVGWVISKEGPNFVDFGIYNSAMFVNNQERSLILDFNVDGVIFDKI